jgi:hypothetical protein
MLNFAIKNEGPDNQKVKLLVSYCTHHILTFSFFQGAILAGEVGHRTVPVA